jgi:hypothetical protein
MINFVLMVNKQGQTRLSNYYNWLTIDERSTLESEIIRKCLSRTEAQCSFIEFRGMKVVYRRYASLFFIVGVEPEEEVSAQFRLQDLPADVRARARVRARWAAAACSPLWPPLRLP